MKKVLGSFLILAFQLSFAQSVRNVGSFTSLKVYNKLNVKLIESNENKVETETEDAEVETINKNGELKIKLSPAKILQGGPISVKVYYQKINDIQASQGSTITSTDEMETSMLSLISNEGSKIDLNVDAEKLNVKTNSGGEVKISGKADNQDIVVNSGGKYYGQNAVSKNTSVTSNAGGFAEVNVKDSVKATTRAGGIIDIYGDPDDRKVKNVIGGKINFK